MDVVCNLVDNRETVSHLLHKFYSTIQSGINVRRTRLFGTVFYEIGPAPLDFPCLLLFFFYRLLSSLVLSRFFLSALVTSCLSLRCFVLACLRLSCLLFRSLLLSSFSCYVLFLFVTSFALFAI